MEIRGGYDPGLFGKAGIVVWELLFCGWLLLSRALPFLWDVVHTNLLQRRESRLPGGIAGLLDPELFSKLSGRAVSKVEYSVRLEQHANSTDRAWFRVKYEDEAEDAFVFAKVQAKTLLVRSIMSLFDVYRNELHTYQCVTMPVLTPAVHIARWTPSRFVLALSDLRHEGVEFPNIWETKEGKVLARKVLSTLAKIHGRFWENVPHGAWNDACRPYKPTFMGVACLHNVNRICPGLIPADVNAAFTTALWRWDELRAYWSRTGPKTLVHGDAHMGNFYLTKSGEVGTFDFQVKAEEHPMRDVAYHLSSSFTEDLQPADVEELVAFYLEQLAANGVPKDQVPSLQEALLQYRLHLFYAMYAFVFSGGFADLMDKTQTTFGVGRIVKQIQRMDAASALYDLLDGKLDGKLESNKSN